MTIHGRALTLAALLPLAACTGRGSVNPNPPSGSGVPCGGSLEPCCTAPNLCSPGLTCVANECQAPPRLPACGRRPDGLGSVSSCPSGETCAEMLRAGDAGRIDGCARLCTPGAADGGCPRHETCLPEPSDPAVTDCRPVCFQSSDCPEGFSCDSGGVCRCASDAACRAYGAAATCSKDGQCVTGCKGDLDCGCGSSCSEGVCVAGCTTDVDCCGGACQAGQCQDAGPGALGTRCYPGSCASGLVCLGQIPYCSPEPSTAACEFTGCDCADGGCDPTCVAYACPCTASTCPAGTVCQAGQRDWSPVDQQGVDLCLLPCRLDGGACPPGWSCAPSETDPPQGVCEVLAPDAGPCARDSDCDDGGLYPAAVCQGGSCVCSPQCAGRSCGIDGCGGVCGSCPAGQACAESGQCVPPFCGGANFAVRCPDGHLVPNDASCPDGGGASTCLPGFGPFSCDGGLCERGTCSFPDWWCAPCTPSCGGKTCGSDGCGGNCGLCATGQYCDSSGQCQADPASHRSGSGPDCQPACAGGQVCVNHRCRR
ncbi:MAG: hypothetical protein ACYDCL_06690 [Myxococcales bacterium]